MQPWPGAPFTEQSSFVGKENVFIGGNWSLNVNGLVQLGKGINVATNVFGRAGYASPIYLPVTPSDGQTRNLALTAFDQIRLDDILLVDARIEKEFSFNDFGLTLGVDVFNLFNKNFALQREGDQSSPRANFPKESVGTRTFRFGARFSFR